MVVPFKKPYNQRVQPFKKNYFLRTMIHLRPYQTTAVNHLRSNIINGNNKLILCAPTGAGKTVIFSYLISRAVTRQRKCLILTHRMELLTQAGGSLRNFGLIPLELKPGRKIPNLTDRLLVVGMAQTIKRRLGKEEYKTWLGNLDLVIIDEAHTQDAELILPHLGDKTTVIGATATPHREGNQKELAGFYKNIVEVTTIPELIEQGYLSKPNTFGVHVDLSSIRTKGGEYDTDQMGQQFSETRLYEGVLENYNRITPGKKAIIFASNVESSKTLVEDFKSKGMPIEHIDGTTPNADRKRILECFRTTNGAMISNVGILNAGFDDPTIEVVILYRATKSLPLFLQMCGRGSRIANGKNEFTILDFGNNIQRHGFWEENRSWSLKNKKKKKGEGEAPVKTCPSCSAILHASVRDCEYCGHHFEPTEQEVKERVIAELKRMTFQQIRDEIATADFKRLEEIAEAKGYRKGWIYHQLKTEEDIRNYGKWKGYHDKWVDHQIELREKNYEY